MTTIIRSRPILSLVLAIALVLLLAVAFVLPGMGSTATDINLAGASWSGPAGIFNFDIGVDFPGVGTNGASWS